MLSEHVKNLTWGTGKTKGTNQTTLVQACKEDNQTHSFWRGGTEGKKIDFGYTRVLIE